MSEISKESPWKDPAIWGRVVFVVLFLLIFALIVGPLAIVFGIVQALFMIFTGEENRNLRGLAAALAEYVREILLFASWNREQKPFPFSEFPRSGEHGDAEESREGEPTSEPSPAAESGARDTANAEQKVCPECGYAFQGTGWQGIDTHWNAHHSHIMPYGEAEPLIKAGRYCPSGSDEPE